jgi:hypothetical protein
MLTIATDSSSPPASASLHLKRLLLVGLTSGVVSSLLTSAVLWSVLRDRASHPEAVAAALATGPTRIASTPDPITSSQQTDEPPLELPSAVALDAGARVSWEEVGISYVLPSNVARQDRDRHWRSYTLTWDSSPKRSPVAPATTHFGSATPSLSGLVDPWGAASSPTSNASASAPRKQRSRALNRGGIDDVLPDTVPPSPQPPAHEASTSPRYASFFVSESSLAQALPPQVTLSAVLQSEKHRVTTGDLAFARWADLDGVRGVITEEQPPLNDDGFQRVVWITYRLAGDHTQMLILNGSCKARDFSNLRDVLYAIFSSVRFARP